jgi:hypothetical protein
VKDRELLEAAAKAAGMPHPEFHNEQWGKFWIGGHGYWNPLTDDGDAFRLAVKLRLDLYNYGRPVHDEDFVDAIHMDGSRYGSASEELGDDPYAATRRAIVRAAAAIGDPGRGA